MSKEFQNPMTVHTERAYCPYDCPSCCGFFAEVENGRVKSVKGDPDHPGTKGLLCLKMQNYEKSVNSPDRILTPLIRTGKKGSGLFRRASWEECLETIAARWKEILRTDGPDAIAHFFGSGLVTPIQRQAGTAFFNYMGACRLVHTLCCASKGAGYSAAAGHTGCLDGREIEDSDLYLVWSSNVAATRLQVLAELVNARKKGKRVITIEVFGGPMKKYSDDLILVRPGTDGALALAMMNVLVREGLAAKDYLEKWGIGYARFRRTLPQYTPQWASEITGVPAEKIEELARTYAAAKAPVILLGSGVSRYRNGGMNCRLITILSFFTGAWEKPGGGMCAAELMVDPVIDMDRVKRPDFRKKAPGKGKGRVININQMGPAICDPSVKSFYVYAGNPANSVSDAGALLRGLQREDLFTVVHERFMTDTARYADIILPATFSVEHSDVYTASAYTNVSAGYKIVDPPGECKSNWDTFALLAKAMGYEDPFFKQTEEEFTASFFRDPAPAVRACPEELRRAFAGLAEKSGTVSFPYPDHLHWKKEGGFRIVNEELEEALPRYLEPYGGPEDLRLISVPSAWTLNGIFTEREDILKARGPRTLVLHPADAAARGIRDGDRVIAENDLAAVEFTAAVTHDIVQGAAAVVGNFAMENDPLMMEREKDIRNAIDESSGVSGDGAHPEFHRGPVPNALHHARLTDLAESTTMNDNTVNVRKA